MIQSFLVEKCPISTPNVFIYIPFFREKVPNIHESKRNCRFETKIVRHDFISIPWTSAHYSREQKQLSFRDTNSPTRTHLIPFTPYIKWYPFLCSSNNFYVYVKHILIYMYWYYVKSAEFPVKSNSVRDDDFSARTIPISFRAQINSWKYRF